MGFAYIYCYSFDFGVYFERYNRCLCVGFDTFEMDLGRRSLVLFLVGFVFVGDICFGTANIVFDVKHKFGGRIGRSLGVLRAHDSHRHGRMLETIDLPLGGKGRAGDSSFVPNSFALTFMLLILLRSL